MARLPWARGIPRVTVRQRLALSSQEDTVKREREDCWPRQRSDGALQGGDGHPATREGEPTMPAANPEQSIFLAALELPTPAERAAYLKGACGADPALLANVRELLAAHEKDDGFLDRPPSATVDE